MIGTPDLVVEIVSDWSARKDRVLPRRAYARAGIPEHRVIDARGESIRFEILHLVDGAYVASAPADTAQASRVLARRFTLTRARNRAGHRSYRLRAVA